jgi:hypothetical protein
MGLRINNKVSRWVVGVVVIGGKRKIGGFSFKIKKSLCWLFFLFIIFIFYFVYFLLKSFNLKANASLSIKALSKELFLVA